MGSFSIYHMLILLVIVVLVFGTRRLPSVMGDFAKGIKEFKSGMRDDGKADDQATLSQAAPQQPVPGHSEAVAADRKVG
jgi:sec-independent protein translocase protein TatA